MTPPSLLRGLSPLWCSLLVVACSSPEAPPTPRDAGNDLADALPSDAASDVTDVTDVTDVPMRRLPAIEGLTELPDMNPDPRIVEVRLTAAPAVARWRSGVETSVLAYNGTIPGPLIHARVGDRVIIHFRNELDDDTTIHWHGLRISDVMDGSPAIQEPVRPGGEFTYDFVVPDAATFWYHSHVGTEAQIERGLYGALVVHEADPPPVDRERIFVLDDVKLSTSGQIAPALTSGPDIGRGRYGNVLLTNGQTAEVTATAARNAVERWRLVSAANARSLRLHINGATWRVVGTDGGLLPTPYETSELVISPGQRFDLEVRMDDASAAAAQLITTVLTGLADGGTEDREYTLATVNLDGEVKPRPAWVAPAVTLPPTSPASPLSWNWALSGRVADGGVEFTINGMAGLGHGSHTGTHDFIERVPQNRPVRITLRSDVSPEHPFHLHGQFFQIVAPASRARLEPGLKDVVLVRGAEAVTVLTYFENPGQWMVHCHIAEHAERGMMSEVMVLPPSP
jgi:FtsP/CotA-like multicopper oxidase with cupredoxin domain